MSIKSHFISQFERRKREISLPEYLFWWALRLSMITAFSISVFTRGTLEWVMIMVNTIVTFAFSILELLVPQKYFLGRIHFRVQTFIAVYAFCGSFLGHFVHLYRYEGIFDKYLHLLAGFLMVFIGYELMIALYPDKKPLRKYTLFGACGFSCLAMVFWELFEFFADFLLNSNNQAYTKGFADLVYTDSYFFIRIFGRGKAGAEQLAVFDTNIDLMAAVVGTIAALAVLNIILKKREKKATEITEE